MHVGDVESNVAELVRHDSLGLKFLVREGGALEDFQDRAFGVLEGHQLRDRGLRILFALRLDAVGLHLLFESGEIVALADLKGDAHAVRLRAFAQDHGVMIDRVGEKGGVLFLADERHAQDARVVVGLLFDVGHFIAGVGDLAHTDHADPPLGIVLRAFIHVFERRKELITSTILAPSNSPKPIAMKRS